jgi:response regulator NasT
MVEALRPDVAIFDIKMPGMSGLEAAKIVSDKKICPVVMLTAFSQREIIEQARDAGALAYLVKPFQKTDLVPAIELAIARFAELRSLSGEVAALGAQLETRKLIDRAKGVLIDKHRLSESDAFAFIQSMAMSQRMKMGDIAEQIIAGKLNP